MLAERVGPSGTGKSHCLIGLGEAAIHSGLRIRNFAAAVLIETTYRGLCDNSVGRVIESLLRADLVVVDELGFAPLDAMGSQLLFRFVAAANERPIGGRQFVVWVLGLRRRLSRSSWNLV